MASTFEMTLAGKRYALASPLVREPIPDVSQQWRQGAPDYADRQGAQYQEWTDLSGGLGLDMMDCNDEEHRRRTWSEDRVDTRWPGMVILGPLVLSTGGGVPAPTPSTPQYGRFLDIPGAVLFSSASASWKCTIWRNAGTTWNRVFESNITNAEKGRDWAFPVPDGVDQRIYLGTGGALFSSPISGLSFAACGSSFPARAIGYDFGEESLICQKTKDDAHLYSITGHPTTPVATDIAHMGGLVGDFVSFYDADGKFVPYISVFKAPSGDSAGKPLASLYTVDLIEGKVYPVADAPPAVYAPASAETWKNICVWQGWIYMFLAHDLYRYRPGQWESVPVSKTSFIPWGLGVLVLTGMVQLGKWLYLLGTYNSVAYIFAIDQDGGWHCLTRSDGAGGDLCFSDDWVPSRLWFFRAASASRYIELPQGPDNPIETVTYQYEEATGSLVLPWFDGHFAETEGTALRVTVVADKLSADETVEIQYRTVRDATWTSLGLVTSTSTPYFDFASGVGYPFKIIQLRFNLYRGADATKTSIIRRIVFTYLKKPPVRYRYTASIEVKGTRSGLRSMETVLAELETAYDATTLRELKYGRVTANVNIVGLNFVERPATQKTGQRNVYQIQVAMEEPI